MFRLIAEMKWREYRVKRVSLPASTVSRTAALSKTTPIAVRGCSQAKSSSRPSSTSGYNIRITWCKSLAHNSVVILVGGPAVRSVAPRSSDAPFDRGGDPSRSRILWKLPRPNVRGGVLVSVPRERRGQPKSAPAHVKQTTQSTALRVGNAPKYVEPNGQRTPPASTLPQPINLTFCLWSER